jgi:hypothetical protein
VLSLVSEGQKCRGDDFGKWSVVCRSDRVSIAETEVNNGLKNCYQQNS